MINPDYFNNPDFFVYLCKRYKMRIRIKNPIYGVPLTFLDRYNPNQFRIVGLCNDKRDDNPCFIKCDKYYLDDKHKEFRGCVLNDKATYARIFIQKI